MGIARRTAFLQSVIRPTAYKDIGSKRVAKRASRHDDEYPHRAATGFAESMMCVSGQIA